MASCWRVCPLANSRPIWSRSCGFNALGLPPMRPCALAAANPASVRSTISSRSISASADITWKKKRPMAVLVSILSVKERKWAPRSCSSDISAIRFLTLRPNLSSFHTTRVSPLLTHFKARLRPGRLATFPLMRSSKMWSQFALVSALRCKSQFWSIVDTRI